MQEQLSNIRSWLHKIIWSVPLRPAPFTHKGAKPLKIWKLILRTDFKFLFWDKESFWQNTIGYVVLDIRLRNKHTIFNFFSIYYNYSVCWLILRQKMRASVSLYLITKSLK